MVSFSGKPAEAVNLSLRDKQLISMWLSGLSLRQISKYLGISHMTVKRRIDKYVKMGLEVELNS